MAANTNSMAGAAPWSPDSWRTKKVAQDVVYPDQNKLASVLQQLRTLPPLVTPMEIERLRKQLADVSEGKAFLLQGGDCAELFSYCRPSQIDAKVKLLLLMSMIIIWGARVPIVRVGRIAGQYAKPRSKPTEMVDGKEVLSFRGDNVNGFDPSDRTPDPNRLLMAYFHSASTLNHLRASLASGIADLHAPRDWSFSHVRSPTLQREFENIVEHLTDALDFMRTVGADPGKSDGGLASALNTVDLFTSHEGLLLDYEEALTRILPVPTTALPTVPRGSLATSPAPSTPTSASVDGAEGTTCSPSTAPYASSAHFIWIGDRTRQLDGAHVEYFRGIRNPVGVKVGPTMKPDELVKLLDVVDPWNEPGRVTLIGRYGASKIDDHLPGHIRAVAASTHRPIWVCDPMHGNTTSSPANPSLKTRSFADIVLELSKSLRTHTRLGLTRLGGVHLELTGETNEEGFSVTECTGGSMELGDEDLSLNYQTHCDPRLNFEQSLDVAFLISHHLKKERRGRQRRANGGSTSVSRSASAGDEGVETDGDPLLDELVQRLGMRR